MTKRFLDVGKTIYEFGGEFLVRCPRCSQCARVTRVMPPQSDAPTVKQPFGMYRCICSHCGYIHDWHKQGMSVGGSRDWCFGLPVWLQTPCRGRVLWAYNADHLSFLRAYVQADLRERIAHGHTNGSLASRLPTWMKSTKNRDEVLKGITRLEELLIGSS